LGAALNREQATPMCGRFASQSLPEEIARLFGTVGALRNFGPNWNRVPTQPATGFY
jgi:hypothetical protein